MKAITTILENQIIQAWIAPIVTTVLIALGGYGINIFRKKRQVQQNINIYSAAEEKLVEIIRPFFIQELMLDKNVIEDTRNAIIREFGLDGDVFIKIDDVKNIIILDILRTRFIKEEDKKKLIESAYNVFNYYGINCTCKNMQKNIDSKDISAEFNKIDLNKDYLKYKNLEIEKYNRLLIIIISGITCIIFLLTISSQIKMNIGSIEKIGSYTAIIMSILAIIITAIGIIPDFLGRSSKKVKKINNFSEILKEMEKEIDKTKEEK